MKPTVTATEEIKWKKKNLEPTTEQIKIEE